MRALLIGSIGTFIVYAGITQLVNTVVMPQIKSLQAVYSNVDSISEEVVAGASTPQ